MGQGLSLALSIGVPLIGGMVGGLVSQKDVLTWYQDLKKPKWTPPSFVFAPAWTVLYIMQGTASWFVWRGKASRKGVALGLYAAQLALNLIWNPLFFKTHKTDVALVDITALLGLATAATVTMSQAHKPAVQLPLMIPYLLWVSFATALNADIMVKNPSERLIKSKGRKAKEAKQEKSKKSPAAAVKGAAGAVQSGVAAGQSAGEAVQEGRQAVKHAGAATAPLAAAKDAVVAAEEKVSHLLGGGGGQGASGSAAAPEPAGSSADVDTSKLAPAAQSLLKEVEQAGKAGGKGLDEPVTPPSSKGAAEAIESELREAVAATM